MSTVLGFIRRVYRVFNPPLPPHSDSKPIKFGILGAAQVAPAVLIRPAKSHPEVEVYAVAARDEKKAAAFAKKYVIPKVYTGKNGYQDLLDDPNVDVVYNPLPNSLHYEWTMKALAAGKHVLLEKPIASTVEETRAMFELAERKGLVLMEGFHYRFYPATQRVKAIIDSGELGALKSITGDLVLPQGKSENDIQYNYDLGGGALMGLGCYIVDGIRYLSSSEPISVLSASHVTHTPPSSPVDFIPNIDRRTVATLSLPNDVVGTVICDLGMPRTGFLPRMPHNTIIVECEDGKIELSNYMLPTLYHSITVSLCNRASRVEKAYTFENGELGDREENWWMSYRYQLEAFVDRLRGKTPQTWVTAQDSAANMEWIEKIYAKTGLGSLPKSTYIPPKE